jgi:hypothetical protein
MSLQVNAVMTLDQAKTSLNLDPNDDQYDDLLEGWVNFISDRIEKMIDNKAALQTVTEYLDGTNCDTLIPTFYPISALSGTNEAERLASLQYRNLDGTWSNLMTSENKIHIYSYYIRIDDVVFPGGACNIKIVYKAGFSPMHGTIALVAREMLQMLWNESRHGSNWLGKSSVSDSGRGGSSGDSLLDMNPRWNTTLEHMRRIV